ncbi:hypothetical protein MPSEU_000722700 [Mayamaea pseudoterrestris]|nr:hypothetical protein MPSEU_000722700 [Mayamaea pseudoterrestris]
MMKARSLLVSCFVAVIFDCAADAFRLTTLQQPPCRRQFVEALVTAAGVMPMASILNPKIAYASGGATAGGVYLLSAKQRYNDRVKAGIKGFLALGPDIDTGNLNNIRPYFAQEETGSWKDLSTAGYLLANAFRRNSTASPDSLPSVKKWKAFAAQVEALVKALKGKNSAAAQAAYQAGVAALDDYLTLVELPLARDL